MLQLVKYENGLVWQMAMNSFWFPSLRCEVYFRIPWIQAGLTLRERLCEFQCLGSGGPAASIFAFLAIVARWPDTTMLWKSWSTVLEDKKPHRGEKRWPSQQLAPITRHENETILDEPRLALGSTPGEPRLTIRELLSQSMGSWENKSLFKLWNFRWFVIQQ